MLTSQACVRQGQRAEVTDNCPDLASITGSLDWRAWRSVHAGSDDYERWRGAWDLQDGWDGRTHDWYWRNHLRDWPRPDHRITGVGLKAARVAVWLRKGYSRVQCEDALGYGRDGAPKSLWERARDYGDWIWEKADFLEIQAILQPEDELDSRALLAWHEALYASTVDPTVPTGGIEFSIGDDSFESVEEARRWVRHRWRTPRVVTLAEREERPWGLPDPYSGALLYSDHERRLMKEAAGRIESEVPFRQVPDPIGRPLILKA
jgi:hypothetical protein